MMPGPFSIAELDGLYFAEGPRWYADRLWFSDVFGHRVLTGDGISATAVDVVKTPDDFPSGLGWLPDGRLLVVGMTTKILYRLDPDGLVVHADLSGIVRGMTNDMVVGADGTAYVGDSGLPPFGQPGARLVGQIIAVRPDGRFVSVADGLAVPNGIVLTPDERTLIVAESGAAKLTAFDVWADGTLGGRRTFAELLPPGEGEMAVHPDGICLDAEGAVWVADLTYREVIRVHEGGHVSERIALGDTIPIACVLGGPDRRMLFVCVSEHTDIARLGLEPVSRIIGVNVAVAGAQRAVNAPARPPLEGVRILEFGIYAAAPYAASLLGDMGAEVIKIEPPGGEPFRHLDEDMGPGQSAYFYGINRSKRSMVLDLGNPESRPVLHKLVTSADAVVVSYRPEVVSRLGLAYENIAAIKDTIVYLGLTAWGETGPRAHQPGMDLLAQAVGGIMGVTGEKGGPPVKSGAPIGDFVASLHIVSGILAALRVRDRDGIGQKVTFNLLDGVLSVLPNFVTPYTTTRVPIEAEGSAHPYIVPYQAFQSSDKWFIVACPSTHFFHAMCDVLGFDDWRIDEELTTNKGRNKRREEIIGRMSALFATRRAQEWLDLLATVQVPSGPVNSLADAIGDPQTVHNQTIVEMHHPEHGSYYVVQNPLRFTRTPVQATRYAADLGEDTNTVLATLGFDIQVIDTLRDRGVVQ
jgi:crotonobetainyl-CoA:carnitine CoA-transferase CaiB-like acyl-CoA transferase/sugar lactone lactonase YvrE